MKSNSFEKTLVFGGVRSSSLCLNGQDIGLGDDDDDEVRVSSQSQSQPRVARAPSFTFLRAHRSSDNASSASVGGSTSQAPSSEQMQLLTEQLAKCRTDPFLLHGPVFIFIL